MLTNDAEDASLIAWAAPLVWRASFSIYTATTCRSNSLADEMILVAISPLMGVSMSSENVTFVLPIGYQQAPDGTSWRSAHDTAIF